jgi:hypothetical protein
VSVSCRPGSLAQALSSSVQASSPSVRHPCHPSIHPSHTIPFTDRELTSQAEGVGTAPPSPHCAGARAWGSTLSTRAGDGDAHMRPALPLPSHMPARPAGRGMHACPVACPPHRPPPPSGPSTASPPRVATPPAMTHEHQHQELCTNRWKNTLIRSGLIRCVHGTGPRSERERASRQHALDLSRTVRSGSVGPRASGSRCHVCDAGRERASQAVFSSPNWGRPNYCSAL